MVTENFSEAIPIEFTVTSSVDDLKENLYSAVVTVTRQVKEKTYELESERTIRFVPK